MQRSKPLMTLSKRQEAPLFWSHIILSTILCVCAPLFLAAACLIPIQKLLEIGTRGRFRFCLLILLLLVTGLAFRMAETSSCFSR